MQRAAKVFCNRIGSQARCERLTSSIINCAAFADKPLRVHNMLCKFAAVILDL